MTAVEFLPASAEIANSSLWVVDKVSGQRPKRPDLQTADLILDAPEDIDRATEWLKNKAPTEGTYAVACALLDLGLSVPTAAECMADVWNERRAEPRPYEHILERVEHASRYRRDPIGSRSASVEFEDESTNVKADALRPVAIVDVGSGEAPNEVPVPHQDAEWPKATPGGLGDPRDIPPRDWLVHGFLARTFVTAAIAPGGTGKTNLAAALSISLATGRSDILGFEIGSPINAWYWNQEDDKDELGRRLAASMQLHRVTAGDLQDDARPRFFLDSGVDRPLILVTRKANGKLEPAAAVGALIKQIQQLAIGVLIIDPLVEFHEADENNNSEMALVWRVVRRIAVEANCAVLVVAHTRKPPGASAEGHTGDVNSLRGAGAQAGVMRLAVTLSTMTAREAAALKVPSGQKGRFVKVEGAKHNLTAKDAAPVWFENVGVVIANGEEVGAMRPAQFGLIAKARPPLGDRGEALLAAFWSALRKKGAFETYLSTEEWEAEAWPIWAEAGSSASKVRENIRKCRSSLEEKGVVKKEKRNQWVAIYPEEPEEPEVES